jgi:hypothetical protein
MFLGIPLDYRNTFDIANAVATFGTYHNWHHDDDVLDRTLVFASYPSAATLSRDVVFGRYANIGAARESWTAPCYVLNAAFADVIPLDEDPMPFDGNPHPLPGNLIPNNNMFVLPHYPELGWNVNPNQQPEHEPEVIFEEEVQEPVEEIVVDSIVLNPSNASAAQQLAGEEVNQNVHLGLHCPLVCFGKEISKLLFSLLLPMKCTSLCFRVHSLCCCIMVLGQRSLRSMLSLLLWQLLDPVSHRKVARALCFEEVSVSENSEEVSVSENSAMVFLASPVSTVTKRRRGKGKKYPTPFVDSGLRRSKRTCVRQDGYKPGTSVAPISIKALAPASGLDLHQEDPEENEDTGHSPRREVLPKTPIPLMQSIGVELGIDPSKIAEEKLRVAPKSRKSKKVSK